MKKRYEVCVFPSFPYGNPVWTDSYIIACFIMFWRAFTTSCEVRIIDHRTNRHTVL